MATTKFRDASPYVKPTPQPPKEDYLHTKYLADLEMQAVPNKDPIIGVAIFGLGRAGIIHLATLAASRRVKVLYIVEDDESKWDDIKTYWRLDAKILASKNADVLYKDPKVDAVVVCSPTFTHEDIVRKSLESRKAVFCEKPIAEDAKRTAKCYETAEKYGKPLFCAFNRRFDPSYKNVHDRVRAGEVGHAHIVKVTARDSPLPSLDYIKTSGGIFHDCMVHDIDMMTWVLGEYPTKVSVLATSNIPEMKAIDDFDTVIGNFQFPSGTVASVDISRNAAYGYDQRFEVFGPKGMVEASNEQPLHCVTTQYGLAGQRKPPIWYSFPSRFRNGYIGEMEAFLEVVLGKQEPEIHAKEILAVSKIASAAEESARTGKVVELKWTPDEIPPSHKV